MKRRWIIAITSACMLASLVWQLHEWNTRIETRRMNAQRGRESAQAFINAGYLYISIGEGKSWRPVYEQLLNERYGLKFHHRPSGAFCGYKGNVDEVMERSMMEVNNEELARRFQPGQLELLAEEAERIYREQQKEKNELKRGDLKWR